MKMKKINGIRRCRLCACEEDFNSFSNIFDDNPEMELEMKITKLLPVVVMPWDPMPHVVCHKCIEKLNLFNDFYEASLKAERFLRTLHPSAPENELEDLNPVVEVIDPPILRKSPLKLPLKLPLKKRQGISPTSYKAKKDSSPEIDIIQSPGRQPEEIYPKRTLNCFIINQISNRDSVFTCRECFRTFTKQSSALTHSCVRIEDCAEIETVDVDDEAEKSLPPLKIRLFSVRSGLFVCYLCQAPFEQKAEVIEHIRRHILEDGKKSGKPKGKRKGRCLNGSDEDEDWEETYKKKAVRRKRKKCSGPPKKRGRPKNEEATEECQSGMCAKCGKWQDSLISNSPAKETVERTTQYSEVSDHSDGETQNKDEQTSVTVNPDSEIPPRWAETTVNIGVQEKPDGNHSNMSSPYLAVEPTKDLEPEDEAVPEAESMSDEVTVLEVINNRTPTSFSSCVFCDKIFATKDALITHQNKHMQRVSELKTELEQKETLEVARLEEETFLCSICAMIFTDKKTLLEHEQYHLVDTESMACQRRIRIALAHEFSERDIEPECQFSKGREIITITFTAGEKKIPQIEFV